MIEIDLADSNPVIVQKVVSRNKGLGPRKADLATLDREKMYKRLGFDPEQKLKEQEGIIMD